MSVIFLESKDNPKIKHLRALIEQNSYRKKQGQTVLEGTHLCQAWLEQDKKINSIFTTEPKPSLLHNYNAVLVPFQAVHNF